MPVPVRICRCAYVRMHYRDDHRRTDPEAMPSELLRTVTLVTKSEPLRAVKLAGTLNHTFDEILNEGRRSLNFTGVHSLVPPGRGRQENLRHRQSHKV